jgi:hypothetical protein
MTAAMWHMWYVLLHQIFRIGWSRLTVSVMKKLQARILAGAIHDTSHRRL